MGSKQSALRHFLFHKRYYYRISYSSTCNWIFSISFFIIKEVVRLHFFDASLFSKLKTDIYPVSKVRMVVWSENERDT